MGYYTKYRMTWDTTDTEMCDKIGDFIEDDPHMGRTMQRDGRSEEPTSQWRSPDDDMRAMSVAFAGVLFHLAGDGESAGDLWDMFAKDGKIQAHVARVVRTEAPTEEAWK